MTDFASIRQDLHCHPGISGDEHYAHDLIVRQLNACHPDAVFTHVGGFGVVAIWGKEPSRPTIAVRCDIDALPIGHRCGHDGHTTILLQLAEQISDKYPQTFNGINIILVFQPEEETGTGSQKIIDAGILQQYNIKAIYGFHNLPGFPLGTVVLNYHTFAAASTGVIYRLTGRNTHASTPEKGLNPGLAVAEIIQSFNRLNSTDTDIDRFRQSTLICVRLGEEAFGTSAGQADIMFKRPIPRHREQFHTGGICRTTLHLSTTSRPHPFPLVGRFCQLPAALPRCHVRHRLGRETARVAPSRL